MPNQRAPGTEMLSVPMPRALKRDLMALAAANDKSLALFVRDALRKLAVRSLAAKKAKGVA